MRHLAAYLLATLGGNETPSADDIKKILGSVGIEAEESLLEKTLSELSGKDVNQLVQQGFGKLASMPAASAAPVASSGSAAPAASAASAKETKKEEVKEESDEEMGFGLFD